jgi:hypothetical protein
MLHSFPSYSHLDVRLHTGRVRLRPSTVHRTGVVYEIPADAKAMPSERHCNVSCPMAAGMLLTASANTGSMRSAVCLPNLTFRRQLTCSKAIATTERRVGARLARRRRHRQGNCNSTPRMSCRSACFERLLWIHERASVARNTVPHVMSECMGNFFLSPLLLAIATSVVSWQH